MVLSNHTENNQIPGDFFLSCLEKKWEKKTTSGKSQYLALTATTPLVWCGDNSVYFTHSLRVEKDESVPYF